MSDKWIAVITVSSIIAYWFGVGAYAKLAYGWKDGSDWDHPGPILWPLFMWSRLATWIFTPRVRKAILPKAVARDKR